MWGGGGGGRGSEVLVKIQKKFGGGVQVGGGRSQGGCEQRIEVFVKIQKNVWGGGVGLGGGQGRVKFFMKIQKKFGGGGSVRGGGGKVTGWM